MPRHHMSTPRSVPATHPSNRHLNRHGETGQALDLQPKHARARTRVPPHQECQERVPVRPEVHRAGQRLQRPASDVRRQACHVAGRQQLAQAHAQRGAGLGGGCAGRGG